MNGKILSKEDAQAYLDMNRAQVLTIGENLLGVKKKWHESFNDYRKRVLVAFREIRS